MEEIRIIKKNHAVMLVEAEGGTTQELVDYFSFRPEGYQFMPSYKNKFWDGYVRLYQPRQKELYTGLFPYLEEFAKQRGYNLRVDNNSVFGLPMVKQNADLNYMKDLTLTSRQKQIVPRDYQIDAVRHAIENKQAILLSPTASGKSFIIYLLIQYYLRNNDKRVLVIVPTTSLVHQMKGDFLDYSEFCGSLNEDMIHIIMSGKEKDNNKQIVITTWQSVYKLPQSWFEPFGMVIGDEAHTFKAQSLVSIMTKLTHADYRFGTTGTLDGSQVNKLVLEGLFGPVYKVITTKDLIDGGQLAQFTIQAIVLKYSEKTRKEFGKKNYQEELDWIVQNEQRNNFIKNLALSLEGNTLVLFNYVEKHGKPLHRLIEANSEKDRKVFYVSGETNTDHREDVRRITEKEKNAIIVASLGTFSTGINIRNLHNIIFASPSKSQIKVLQSIGRGLRKSDDGRDTVLYDIIDDINNKSKKNYALQHAIHRMEIYSKEQFKFTVHEVPMK